MKIYVAFHAIPDYGSPAPLAAFATKELADIYQSGAQAAGSVSVEIAEMELKTTEPAKPAVPVFRPAEITPRDDFNKLIARY